MPNWVDIPNNTEWQYDDSIQNRTETDPNTGEEVYITYRNSPGVIEDGIRTYTNESGNECKVYIRCRQKLKPNRMLGEVSFDYWDNKSQYVNLFSHIHNNTLIDQYTYHQYPSEEDNENIE